MTFMTTYKDQKKTESWHDIAFSNSRKPTHTDKICEEETSSMHQKIEYGCECLTEKLLRRYFGPDSVLRRVGSLNYEVMPVRQDISFRRRHRKEIVHVIRMKPYHDRKGNGEDATLFDVDDIHDEAL